jgi:hypothetical protein
MEKPLENMSGTWELFDLPPPPIGEKKRRPKDHVIVRIHFKAS